MILLAAPWLLLGLVLAAAPVLLHLARRRRPRDVHWGAMRLLALVAAERGRRLAIDERILLILRCLVLILVVLAATRPQIELTPEAGPELPRAGRVAAVLLIDDSVSGAARGGADFARARALAEDWLGTLEPGDEVTLLPLSRLAEPPADPLTDLGAARARLSELAPTALAGDHPALLLEGISRLSRHRNPHPEVVLVTAGRAAPWCDGDVRWEEVRRRLAAGPRRVALLEPEVPPGASLAVAAVDAGSAFAGDPGLARVVVERRGPGAPESGLLRTAVDGRTIDERRLSLAAEGRSEVLVPLPAQPAGEHLVEVRWVGIHDDVAADDGRWSVLTAAEHLPILLAEPEPGGGAEGPLGHLAVALDPQDPEVGGAFSVRRTACADLADGHLLDEVRAVVIGDAPPLDPVAVAALERFVTSGGGLLVIPGPETDTAHAGRAWWRGGDGFLPCPPGAPVLGETHPQEPREGGHPALAAGQAAHAWPSVQVSCHLRLPAALPADAQAPILLADGSPLMVERQRGRGRVVLLATALAGGWCDLPRRPVFVPFVRGLMLHLAGGAGPPRDLQPGERPVFWGDAPAARLLGPDGIELALADGAWEGRAARVGPPLLRPGGYELHGTGVRWAVSPLDRALRPEPSTPALAARCLGEAVLRAPDAAAVRRIFRGSSREAVELWPWLVAAAIAGLVAEWLLCRRIAGEERRG